MDRIERTEWNRVTQSGKLWDRFQTYLNNTTDRFPKSFQEWIES